MWSDDDVKAFISEQINYYGFEVSPEQSKQGTSPWKRWLWLEKHGFDFAYQSLEREIFSFRIGQDPSGALLEEERCLLLAVRNVMRQVLGLDALSADAREYMLSTVPISNWTHWASLARPFGPADRKPSEDADYTDVTDFAWDLMKRDKPDYIRVLCAVRDYNNDDPELFEDPYTINGTYRFNMAGSRSVMYSYVARHFVARSFDLFLPPGNLALYYAVSERFHASIDQRLMLEQADD